MKSLGTWILSVGLSFSATSWAQDLDGDAQRSDANVGWETGFHLGKILPAQINGVTEILGLGGLRVGGRMGRDTFADLDFTTGGGYGSHWTNVGFSVRLDMPIEDLVGTVYIGPDVTYFSEQGSNSRRVIFGGHVGGGVMSQLGGITWFRADMRFNASPGTSLYISAGFVFRLDGSGFAGGT